MTTGTVDYVVPMPEGGWRLVGSRVSLDSIVHAYWAGRTPEAIVEDFPSLSLEQVYGAVAFYLHNRELIDQHMQALGTLWEQLRQESEAAHGTLLNRIRACRPKTANKEVSA